MASPDWRLFCEHYDVEIIAELRFIRFTGAPVINLLGPYMKKWRDAKEKAAPGSPERFRAKMNLNAPYGKTAMKMVRDEKIPILGHDGIVDMLNTQTEGEGVYLPYGIFVTAYAREYVIRKAQRFADEGRFIYADTDSIHILGTDTLDLPIDPHEFGKFKIEGTFALGKYVRPKAYIHGDADRRIYSEVRIHRDGRREIVPEGIKCAGMPDNIKMQILEMPPPQGWERFDPFETFEGKLVKHRVQGGVYLDAISFSISTTYKRGSML